MTSTREKYTVIKNFNVVNPKVKVSKSKKPKIKDLDLHLKLNTPEYFNTILHIHNIKVKKDKTDNTKWDLQFDFEIAGVTEEKATHVFSHMDDIKILTQEIMLDIIDHSIQYEEIKMLSQ